MSDGGETQLADNSVENMKTEDEPNDKPGASKKKQQSSTGKINPYYRSKIMDQLMNNGCDPKGTANAIRQFKVNSEDAEKFVNSKAEAAQAHVSEECESICYKNINSWLDFSKGKNFHNESNYESALIMIAIADMEHHPDPKETGGVDFQKIYRFLGDVMLGNPTPELNPESKAFLGQEFDNLINMANTTEGDEDCKDLQSTIETKSKQIGINIPAAEKRRRKEFRSLDPLGIDKFISTGQRDVNPK